MASYNSKKNLLKSRDVYNKYYGNFRGVDFSSDHTQVHEQRLAYAVNMYKDYQSGQGQALETIPGFRKRVVLPEEANINGVHTFSHRKTDGTLETKILVHAGESLYHWSNYPKSIRVLMKYTLTLPKHTREEEGVKIFQIKLNEENIVAVKVASLQTLTGESLLQNSTFDAETSTLTIMRSDLSEGDMVYLSYYEGWLEKDDAIFKKMNTAKSTSFVFNNRLYIIDGKNYLVYNGSTIAEVKDGECYVPTTYINIVPGGVNADAGSAHEGRNFFSPKFKTTFVPDGLTAEYYLNEKDIDSVDAVVVYGQTKTAGTDYTVDLESGKITFSSGHIPPVKAAVAEKANKILDTQAEEGETPTHVNSGSAAEDISNADKYPENHAGVEILASKAREEANPILKCTLAAIFDDRIFLSGNPDYPNRLWWCGLNSVAGELDAAYFPENFWDDDGTDNAGITGMLVVADTLMVLKGDTQQDGSVYFHTANKTGDNMYSVIYPSTRGLAGIGCLGACINFLDDPVFVSRLGVEAVGQLSVRYERAIEHRSSLIDANLVNTNLKDAVLDEWNGYLVLLVDGKIFLADSRQRYTHDIGVVQYEWYYLEGIGIYKNQYLEYRYASRLYDEFEGVKVRYCTECKKGAKYCTCGNSDNHIDVELSLADKVFYYKTNETRNLTGTVANAPNEDGNESAEIFDELVSVSIGEGEEAETYNVGVYYTIHEVYDALTEEFVRYEAYLCEGKGNYTGGTFNKATSLKSIEGNLFFGTVNGILCSFNFDKRDAYGEIAPHYYSFDERTIYCGCATKMDCCGVPHLTKNTVKKSTVIKTKSLQESAAKIKVRTNKRPYDQIARINSSLFSFDGMDFSDYSFITMEQSLFAIKEKEKQWVEKQYYIYSDEYLKRFAIYYVAFRYTIAGRYKE